MREPSHLAWLRPALRLSVLALGGLHAWVAIRELSMNEDGISYLDMGDACVRGDWSTAVNAVWSPLYACLLGVAGRIVDPPMEWEFALVHIVNFLIFAFALACFEWFWFRGLRTLRPKRGEARVTGDREVWATTSSAGGSGSEAAHGLGFPEWAWTLMGYALFAWISLQLIHVWAVTPDMLMAALLFLAAGFWVRCTRGLVSARTPLALGATLGLAYLAKAVMFPLAFVFLALLLAAAPIRRRLPRTGLALAAFLAVAGPWVAALTLDKGRFTFGEAGHITYVRYVNGVPYPHWRPEEAPGHEEPRHPTRRIFSDPEIFEFGSPVGGTYPPGYDPSYWYEGVSARFAPGQVAAAVTRNVAVYFDLFVRDLGGPVAAIVLLLLVGRSATRPREPHVDRGVRWGLGVAAVVALGAYGLVHIETRYVGAFLALLAASFFSAVRLPATNEARRLLTAAAWVTVIFLGFQLARFHLEKGAPALGISVPEGPERQVAAIGPQADPASPTALGRAAAAAGLAPGDEIAYVGYAFGAYFARLARLRIIAEVPWDEMERFWAAEPTRREAALDALASTGARAVIAEWAPGDTVPSGWERLKGSRHFLYRLPSPFPGTSAEPPSP